MVPKEVESGGQSLLTQSHCIRLLSPPPLCLQLQTEIKPSAGATRDWAIKSDQFGLMGAEEAGLRYGPFFKEIQFHETACVGYSSMELIAH